MSLNKKVTKEVSIGEALTTKPIDASQVLFLSYPDFEPICSGLIATGNYVHYKIRCALRHPSPMYPNRPPSKNFLWSESFVGSSKRLNSRLEPHRYKNDQQPASDMLPEGGPGEGGSKPGSNSGSNPLSRKALRSTPPTDAFFGSFLVRTQEMNTSQFFELNNRNDKHQFLNEEWKNKEILIR